MRLSSALDQEVHVAIDKFIENGIATEPEALYAALQRSNSSLKRRPKRHLLDSIERVIDAMEGEPTNDSEAEAERQHVGSHKASDYLNKSLRANLSNSEASPAPLEKRSKRMANGEPAPKRQKGEKPSLMPPTGKSLEDIGGIEDVIDKLNQILVGPLMYPEMCDHLRVPTTSGVLLHGPPGCGKTMLAQAFAAEMGIPFIQIAGPSIVSGMSGESEKAVRERFDEAQKNAPCIIFLDEIDAIAPKRESSQSQMEKRIVAQLLTCMDELGNDKSKPVVVLAATNRPDSLDPALRRGGRFGTEINIGVPNERAREDILKRKTRNYPLGSDVDFRKLAKMTAGYVGADIVELVNGASAWVFSKFIRSVKAEVAAQSDAMDVDGKAGNAPRSFMVTRRLVAGAKSRQSNSEEDKGALIPMEAFESVLPTIIPSSKREGFATIPNVSWNDIGALDSVREELKTFVVRPIQDPESYRAMGLSPQTGILLWGPPGCGKTLLAKAAAAESKANFISIKGPELLNKFVGESEASVRRLFARADASKPCVIFFDELDALVPKRDDGNSEVSNRIVNTLLSELDGLQERSDIWVIGATNRPDAIDTAMLRPGRFGTLLFVDLPDQNGRVEIVRTMLRGMPVKATDLEHVISIVTACDGYSGADLHELCQRAGFRARERQAASIEPRDFADVAKQVKGSVQTMDKYYALQKRFGKGTLSL